MVVDSIKVNFNVLSVSQFQVGAKTEKMKPTLKEDFGLTIISELTYPICTRIIVVEYYYYA